MYWYVLSREHIMQWMHRYYVNAKLFSISYLRQFYLAFAAYEPSAWLQYNL